MKKVLLFLIILIVPFVVQAEDGPFALSFTTKEVTYTFDYTDFNGGYAYVESDKELGFILRYYDAAGTLKKEISMEDYLPYVIFSKGDSLYLLKTYMNFQTNEEYNYIVQFDKDFNVVKEVEFSDSFYPAELYTEADIIALHIKYKENIVLKDDKIYLPDWYDNKIYVFKEDLTQLTPITFTEDEKYTYLEEYYPVYSKVLHIASIDEQLWDSLTIDFSTPVIFNDDYVFVNKTIKTCTADKEQILYPYEEPEDGEPMYYFEDCHKTVVELYDNEYNKLWSKDLGEETYGIAYTEFLDNYILVSIIEKNQNILRVYDFNGNIVQEFKIGDTEFGRASISKTNNGFTVTVSNINPFMMVQVKGASASGDDGFPNFNPIFMVDPDSLIPGNVSKVGVIDEYTTEYNEVYVFSIPIEKETDGHGSINVKTRAIPGEVVTIEVEPAKGFALGSLKVMDEDGNEIPVEDNSFVMGDKKVTVIASFVIGNPNTNTQSVLFVSILAITCGLVFISQKRKLNFLK